MAAPPASTPAYAILRDRMRTEILAGDWPPGTHRTLAALAAQHGVSLSPVREALLGLEGEGLIQMRQHRGAVVPLMDAALMADLYDVRGALQSVLARRAAERGTPEAFAAMAEHMEAYAAAGRRGDAAAALAANDAFHNAIEDAAANAQASALYRARSAFVNTVRFRLGFGPARLAEADAEHRAIHAAIAARQPDAAAAAAFAHAMGAKNDLLKRL
ncbi:GntR family transcriptional regulator [Humitalea sp. 24SJ18S-53]|uniref:GntR family transcriptional regulator n=1 Tax=Humitalea sp. 24SJ18S-53 TaxID=3422307 RepID=UPI003D66B52B